jgi:hypothetical protein
VSFPFEEKEGDDYVDDLKKNADSDDSDIYPEDEETSK